MKKFIMTLVVLFLSSVLLSNTVLGREGDNGYEGGISSGEAPNKTTFDYQEIVFITGEPIVFKGTLTLKKSMKQDSIAATYTYNLKNMDKSATLSRTLSYITKLSKKNNGQTIEETSLTGTPREIIKIGNTTYTMNSYDFTRSVIVDGRPAISYFAGNLWGKKKYQLGTGQTTAANAQTGTITVEATGNIYGYDQYWGTTEVQTINYVIESEQKNQNGVEKWGGTASVSFSSTTTKELRYVENEPNQISFSGGFVQTQSNSSILEYTSRLPEFDAKGISTDNTITSSDSLKLETFPAQTRLVVPKLGQLRGHWAENDIKTLFSLEVLSGNEADFDPEQYISRAEFAAAIVKAAREVPEDPAFASKTAARPATTGRTTGKVVSPFSDVSTDNKYFKQISSALQRGIMTGRGYDIFDPEDNMTVADMLTIFIRALGLENLAPGPTAVTTFRDNDQIPEYARNAVYVAEKIGLVQGDDKGYLYPNDSVTKARASVFVNRFINYMRENIRKDYRERIVNFN